MKKNILTYGAICCAAYIAFLLLMKAANLMQVTQLRLVNYLFLFLVCMHQIKSHMNVTGTFVPFLKVFGITFFTGVWSFLLYSLFLFVYSRFDTKLTELFVVHTPAYLKDVPSVVILFEGSAVSIMVAFITMQYFRRYEEGEVKQEKSPPK